MRADVKGSVAIFPTALGWMCVLWTDQRASRISFGHTCASSAVDAMGVADLGLAGHEGVDPRLTRGQRGLVRRLTSFASGRRDDFADVCVDLASYSGFAQRVLDHCRRIPWGSTTTYGQLAAQAGSAGAARAVGQVMAGNPVPLVIPCHRVLGAGGSLGGFSAPSGVAMKRRLLALEAASQAPRRGRSASGRVPPAKTGRELVDILSDIG